MARDNTLDRRKILKASLALADEEGIEAVTMRGLAHRLNAGTMSLYYYVPSKDALLEGMVDSVFEQVEQPPEDMQDWADRVVCISLSFRKAALAHPAVVPLIATGYVSGPAVLRSMEAYLGAIMRHGFVPETAAQVHRAVTSYTIGYLSLELGGFFGSVVESYRRGGLENSGPGEYPYLSEIAPYLGIWRPEREFETGLRRLLTGLQETLASGPGYSTSATTEPDSSPPSSQ